MRLLLKLILLLPLAGHAEQLPQPKTNGEHQAEYAVKTFLSICNGSLGNKELVRYAAEKEGFQEPPPMAKSMFLLGQRGLAWSKSTRMGPFAISITDQGLCSVFAARNDAPFMRAFLESWLPPEELGFSIKKLEPQSKNGLDTFAYQIAKDGKPYADWVLSTSTLPNATFQGLITFQKR